MGEAMIAGPSGGALGRRDEQELRGAGIAVQLLEAVILYGRQPRRGHDRTRWDRVDWTDYRAPIGIGQHRGPWHVRVNLEDGSDTLSRKIATAEGMPHAPGLYTVLQHDERGCVMSDVPAEIAGCLPFLDRVQREHPLGARPARLVINGLGLGIVPGWLMRRCAIESLDIVELDQDVLGLTLDGAQLDGPSAWAADPRVHLHHADALAMRWPRGTRWDAAWHDIWDRVTPQNLPSMRALHRAYGHRVRWQLSWEHQECRAQLARGATVDRGQVLRDAVCYSEG